MIFGSGIARYLALNSKISYQFLNVLQWNEPEDTMIMTKQRYSTLLAIFIKVFLDKNDEKMRNNEPYIHKFYFFN